MYRLEDLGPGHYTVIARVPDGSLAKTFELYQGARYRANLRMDPRTPSHRHIFVRDQPIKAPTPHPRDAMIASFAVPGAIGVGALIVGIYGAVRVHRLRRRTGPCTPSVRATFNEKRR